MTDGAIGRRWARGAAVAGVVLALCGVAGCGSSKPPAFTLRGSLALTDSTLVGSPAQKLCTGNPASGYEDVAKGTSVTVYDAGGSVVGTGVLGTGRYAQPWSVGSDEPCRFAFAVRSVPGGSKFYEVEVGHRGKVAVTADVAKAGGFAASLGSQ